MTSRKDWRGWARLATSITALAREHQPKLQKQNNEQYPQVVQTQLRPDMVLWSEEARKLILIELTVPWEDGCEEAYERKATK